MTNHNTCGEICDWIALAQFVALTAGLLLIGSALRGILMKLGRNQLIAVCTYGLILSASVVLAATGKVTGAEWLDFAGMFGPIAVGSMLGSSALIKAAKREG